MEITGIHLHTTDAFTMISMRKNMNSHNSTIHRNKNIFWEMYVKFFVFIKSVTLTKPIWKSNLGSARILSDVAFIKIKMKVLFLFSSAQTLRVSRSTLLKPFDIENIF